MKTPKQVWVIFDELDGPHVFFDEVAATDAYENWTAEDMWMYDEVSKPVCYVLGSEGKGQLDGL